MDILDILDKAPTPLGVREIARRLSISATIVQRLVNTLAHYNYVVQDQETKRYSIGYRAFGLGWTLMQKDRLVAETQPHLERLASTHLLNGYLGTLQGNRALYLLSMQSDGPIAIRSVPGSLTFLHSTAMGKVLLAAMPSDKAYELLRSEPLQKLTPETVTDVDALMSQLEEIRNDGFAYVKSENIMGVTSVGAPVKDGTGKVIAALSAAFAQWSSPEQSFDDVTKIVVDTAQQISRALGYSG